MNCDAARRLLLGDEQPDRPAGGQEDDVREWAESNLTGPRDRLRLLQGPAVPA